MFFVGALAALFVLEQGWFSERWKKLLPHKASGQPYLNLAPERSIRHCLPTIRWKRRKDNPADHPIRAIEREG